MIPCTLPSPLHAVHSDLGRRRGEGDVEEPDGDDTMVHGSERDTQQFYFFFNHRLEKRKISKKSMLQLYSYVDFNPNL